MSEDIVVRAEGLGKKYVIGHAAKQESYTALREVLARKVIGVARATVNLVRRQAAGDHRDEEFWALKDFNFEIKRGDVTGIIGRNGAGKSTLLKILSRITEPSEGRVSIQGRVASLLEVGTGFHPELTGRENIFLNGAVLGMQRSEIKRKFDEIVAFAEVERFLDTPVKRYSSGMYVRLAFAVAAHLEPEILIVDEVLAVGDVAFQAKCLGKISGISGAQGRTVIFVSHNMQAVQTLCSKGIFMANGRLVLEGSAQSVVATYLSALENRETTTENRLGPSMKLVRIAIQPEGVISGEPVRLQIKLFVERRTVLKCLQLLISSEVGERVGIIDLRCIGLVDVTVEEGAFTIDLELTSLPLVEGLYRLGIYVFDSDHMGNYQDLAVMRVHEATKRYQFVPTDPLYRGSVEFDFRGTFKSEKKIGFVEEFA